MAFKFSDNRIHLDFEGKCFDIEAAGASVWLQRSLAVIDGARDILKNALAGGELSEENVSEIIKGFVSSFDELLGGGATGEIFGERPISFYDCYEVYGYIAGEIKKFNSDKARSVFENAEK